MAPNKKPPCSVSRLPKPKRYKITKFPQKAFNKKNWNNASFSKAHMNLSQNIKSYISRPPKRVMPFPAMSPQDAMLRFLFDIHINGEASNCVEIKLNKLSFLNTSYDYKTSRLIIIFWCILVMCPSFMIVHRVETSLDTTCHHMHHNQSKQLEPTLIIEAASSIVEIKNLK